MDTDTSRLTAHGYRLTGPRRAIVAELRAAGRYCTANDLYHRLAASGVGLASVYRTLELLAQLGVAERRAGTGGEASYLYCSPRHHHHVVCTRCGLVREVELCPGGELAREAERATRFKIERHTLDFYGLCATCHVTGVAVQQ